jgi:Transcriptional regulator
MPEGEEAARRRGRPPRIDETARRALILAAAEAVFVADGFARASMDDVAQRAGMSKRTLYALYDGKEALLAAMVDARVEKIFSRIAIGDNDGPLAADLVRILGNLAAALDEERSASMMCVILTEAQSRPELGRLFLERGPRRIRAAMAGWLSRQVARGRLRAHDEETAAEILLDMALGNPLHRLLDAAAAPCCAGRDERRIDLVADIFLRGLAPRGAG